MFSIEDQEALAVDKDPVDSDHESGREPQAIREHTREPDALAQVEVSWHNLERGVLDGLDVLRSASELEVREALLTRRGREGSVSFCTKAGPRLLLTARRPIMMAWTRKPTVWA